MIHEEDFNDGVALMDAHDAGWFWSVDPHTLNMYSTTYCVLGQYFGDYTTGREFFKIECGRGQDYGFDTLGGDHEYQQLTEMWRELIEERRKNDV